MRSVFVVIAALTLMQLTACSNPYDNSVDVEYRVTGTASLVDVTYVNKGGGTSQNDDVEVPWSYSFEGNRGDFVYISAQNQGETGKVTVAIYRNGTIIESSTSEGAYVIATASGTL